MARRPWGSPAQRAALAKARLASAKSRHNRKRTRIGRIYSSNPIKRGQGISGLQKNFVPHVRVNQRSQTGGFNVGTIIPGTGKRIVAGAYVRLENTRRTGAIDKAFGKATRKLAPSGTKRGAVRSYLGRNVTIQNPAIRANFPGGQARLGTSRGAGATIIVRGGKHKTPQQLSKRGVQKYDTAIRRTSGTRIGKPRRARRRG